MEDDNDDEVALALEASLPPSSELVSSSVFTLKGREENEAGGCCKTDCKISDFTTVVDDDVVDGFLFCCSAAENGDGIG